MVKGSLTRENELTLAGALPLVFGKPGHAVPGWNCRVLTRLTTCPHPCCEFGRIWLLFWLQCIDQRCQRSLQVNS